ncbi:EF-hand domain-containing protein [Streptomyces huiliensis]|uniref:EF-hand domain-containing protein n=1 Tax=Streptomyces huiliensis TaxID=2876027 RepID=UPI001CBD31CE|nr:EF-hand domain-containing protein [Streptomyces huiliensis]MBZ4321411.1 EF-hand domain-containing protein [Streptomyces huiliensis]
MPVAVKRSKENGSGREADMLGEIQQSNADQVFSTLDTTRDGVIGKDDFQRLAQRVCAMLPNVDAAQAEEIDTSVAAWWNYFREAADSDGDGKVTRQEFLAAVESGVERGQEYIDRFERVARAMIAAADTDGDGLLDSEEIQRLGEAWEIQETHHVETFRRVDSNGDGRISVDEAVQAACDIFLTQDRTSPGATLLGWSSRN